MTLRGTRPGQFQPACAQCKKKFLLAVWADPKVPPTVAPLPEAEQAVRTAAPVAAAAAVSVADDATAPPTEDELFEQFVDEVLPTPPAVHTDAAAIAESYQQTTPPTPAAGTSSSDTPTLPPTPANHEPDRTIPKSAGSDDPTVHASARQTAYTSPPVRVRLGGYQILKKLSEGGMGAVYLAKQTSLDRNVALKVLSPRLASDPQFIARFTREAYAAAQLSHNNVVQIHDIGVERSDGADTNYFSMEFVEGKTLAGLVKDTGKIEPEAAVGLILQAARGLKFAHDHGLIHRDVKPQNLLLNSHGVVKVADLGLVKLAGTAETPAKGEPQDQTVATDTTKTQASVAMGTPAYMPPEQARDAATVDWRADIYSLGCTLYDLLTGHPPFIGKTAAELITKHASEAVVPPDRIATNVPRTLSKIVMKMLAKKPDERFANMGEVIIALEQWLGVYSEQPFNPKQDQQKVLEFAAERFHDSPWRMGRLIAIRAFLVTMPLLILILALPQVGYPVLAAGLTGFTLSTIVLYQLTYGIALKTYFLKKVRELVFDSGPLDWLTYIIILVLGNSLLLAFGLLWLWLAFAVLALVVAIGFYVIVDRAVVQDRSIAVQQAQRLIEDMRKHGFDENTVRHFVCKYSGKYWEEFYECLFGYEAKLLARQAWSRGEMTRNRPKFAAWREPVIQWIDRVIATHRETRQQKLLTRVEVNALEAAGVPSDEADRQGRQNAKRLMEKAAAVREAALVHSTEPAVLTPAMEASRKGKESEPIPKNWSDDKVAWRTRRRRYDSYLHRRYGGPFDLLFGREIRLIVSMLILIGFGLWWTDNYGPQARKTASNIMSQYREDPSKTINRDRVMHAYTVARDTAAEEVSSGPTGQGQPAGMLQSTGNRPLAVGSIPTWLSNAVGSWDGGIAGALLLCSLFFGGRWLGAGAILASAAALFGNQASVPILSTRDWGPAAAALAVWLLAVIFLREPEAY
jgi:serine/threonine protein kinase